MKKLVFLFIAISIATMSFAQEAEKNNALYGSVVGNISSGFDFEGNNFNSVNLLFDVTHVYKKNALSAGYVVSNQSFYLMDYLSVSKPEARIPTSLIAMISTSDFTEYTALAGPGFNFGKSILCIFLGSNVKKWQPFVAFDLIIPFGVEIKSW